MSIAIRPDSIQVIVDEVRYVEMSYCENQLGSEFVSRGADPGTHSWGHIAILRPRRVLTGKRKDPGNSSGDQTELFREITNQTGVM